MIGPKKKPTPPMKVASSTPPERTRADVLGRDDLVIDAASPPAIPAKKPESDSIRKRTHCGS